MSRRIAFGIGVVLLVLASCQGPGRPHATDPAPHPLPPAHHAQVVAHPDDDLLFMNPDLAEGLRSGRPTTGIFLTAGEADVPDKAGYSAARQEGTRAAYAQMVRKPNDWSRGTMPVGHGRLAEVDTLRADPDVKLVFLNLPEDANSQQGRHALTRLRQEPSLTVTTTVPAGAAVPHPQSFDRRAVVEALTALLDAFQPTVVRLQDDQPDGRYQPNWAGVHNHPDHVAGAALAEEAVAAHRPAAFSPVVQTYRDYNVADTPASLSDVEKRSTREAFTAYAGHDVLATGAIYRSWSDNSAYRWPRRGRWAAWGEGGAVQAFAVRAHGLARWTRAPHGVWSGPELLPLPEPLRPQLTVLGGTVVAQSENGSRILVRSPGEPGRWDVVDGPAAADPTENGPPAATVDSDGRIVLAVKNAAGGVSLRRQSSPGSARWQPWTELGGTDVQDGLSLVPAGDGAVHVFAATRGKVLRWEVARTGAAQAEAVPIGPARPAGAPVAERARDGSVRLLVRTDRGGELVERTLTRQGWREDRTTLPGPGGIGDPTATGPGPQGSADLIRVARDGAGNVRVADRAGGPWSEVGGAVTDHPAAVVEPGGEVTLVGLGFDGALLINPGAKGAGGLAFAGWRPAVVPPQRAD
ncbi:PIG-L family deacetylase [Saccharopolyspora mangrovi]|uniref:PIG-L family deacetylase n=1 Tax=Saccharopolyspora mangrovi TaxID=3082379 RepID=A0ABU6AJZ4_9PSEU|nr:PIG-L family deacetylase [Saccharopolyspora sp. S2-29]MEB3371841.1 PIG-L family deacetylase [Saccharopolyspora sp. S2-29]